MPPPSSILGVLGTLLLFVTLLAILTGWSFLFLAALFLVPFVLLSFVVRCFRGPFHNPFDPD